MRTVQTCSTLVLAPMIPLPGTSQASLFISVAPPPLPQYAKPSLPSDSYLWTPGYWGRQAGFARISSPGQSRPAGPRKPAQAEGAGRAMPQPAGLPAMARPQLMAPGAPLQERSGLPHQGRPRG